MAALKTKVLITGAQGFIGSNLCARLRGIKDLAVFSFDIQDGESELEDWLNQADIIFHLAGINRPENSEEYEKGNAEFTFRICEILRQLERAPKIVMSSSIQAELDNPYGLSKRRAEESLQRFSQETGASVSIYRLKNVYGKWCKPNYNSVTATFCHNLAHSLPISVSDSSSEIELVYVDDVVESFVKELSESGGSDGSCASEAIPGVTITLGDLAGRIQSFHDMTSNLIVPDFSDEFNQRLYATYLSYVSPEELQYDLETRADARGNLAEFIKSSHFGQLFVSHTYPGVTRGNHYHHTKTEKFFVVTGEGLIRMRHIESDDVKEYRVSGTDYRVVDIPPGYTHSITNVGDDEMVTLFWASEVFDPDCPDTYYLDIDSLATKSSEKRDIMPSHGWAEGNRV